jgi:hypothetical protein
MEHNSLILLIKFDGDLLLRARSSLGIAQKRIVKVEKAIFALNYTL